MPDPNTAGRVWNGGLPKVTWPDVALPPINLYNAPATGVKHDGDKPRMELLDPLALEGLAQVLTFGAKKYASHNWRGGIVYSRLIAASMRHLFAFLRGEDLDPESGLPHVDHAACCLMFLANMLRTRPDLDDRYKEPA